MTGYTVHEAEIMAREDYNRMRKEYTRMRDIAQKRIQRLSEQAPQSKAYQLHSEGFTKLKNLDKRDLPKAFSELSKFVGAKSSTVSGQRSIKRKTIAAWQKQGIGLNSQNYDKAIKILEEMRKQKMTYGSDKVVELADTMLNLDESMTNQFLDNLDTMLQHTDELTELGDLSGYSFDEVMAALT